MHTFAGRVLLGVSGSIAAYKAVEISSRLRKLNIDVQVAMTSGALQFVTPLTFESITGKPVMDNLWLRQHGKIQHVEQAHDVDLVLLAPATANTLARLACGLADDPFTAIALSTRAPILVAPAMEHGMWHHPATQGNLQTLKSRGVVVLGPESGHLASGRVGDGRMLEPDAIVEHVTGWLQNPGGDLSKDSIVLTAGPTWEPIDPVRILSNRSTGAMGIALAEEALRRGAKVKLVLGPTPRRPIDHPQLSTVRVETAVEMLKAAQEGIENHSIVVGSAAVSDFRVAQPRTHKWKKDEGDAANLQLVKNPDVIATLSSQLRAHRADGLVVGFAAETENVETHAREKLTRKDCDLVVGNLVGHNQGFGPQDTKILIVDRQGGLSVFGPASKDAAARCIWDRVVELRGQIDE